MLSPDHSSATHDETAIVDEAMMSRRSVRAFLPTPVDEATIRDILEVAARGRGLHTCAQAAFAPYHRQIRPVLGISENDIVVCGMALGYEDESKPENYLRTDREPVNGFATFLK